MARDLSKEVKAMLYKVVKAEIRQFTKGDRIGEDYAVVTLRPQKITMANREESHNITVSDEYSMEELPKYLKALEDGKDLKEWNGLFTNIAASLQTVKFDNMFRFKNPTDATKWGKPRSSMNILVFVKEDLTLAEDPEDAARRVIERLGEWITSVEPAVATTITEDIPEEDDEWEDNPANPLQQVNKVIGQLRRKP